MERPASRGRWKGYAKRRVIYGRCIREREGRALGHTGCTCWGEPALGATGTCAVGNPQGSRQSPTCPRLWGRSAPPPQPCSLSWLLWIPPRLPILIPPRGRGVGARGCGSLCCARQAHGVSLPAREKAAWPSGHGRSASHLWLPRWWALGFPHWAPLPGQPPGLLATRGKDEERPCASCHVEAPMLRGWSNTVTRNSGAQGPRGAFSRARLSEPNSTAWWDPRAQGGHAATGAQVCPDQAGSHPVFIVSLDGQETYLPRNLQIFKFINALTG